MLAYPPIFDSAVLRHGKSVLCAIAHWSAPGTGAGIISLDTVSASSLYCTVDILTIGPSLNTLGMVSVQGEDRKTLALHRPSVEMVDQVDCAGSHPLVRDSGRPFRNKSWGSRGAHLGRNGPDRMRFLEEAEARVPPAQPFGESAVALLTECYRPGEVEPLTRHPATHRNE